MAKSKRMSKNALIDIIPVPDHKPIPAGAVQEWSGIMRLSIVVPVYNEVEVLQQLIATVDDAMRQAGISYELVLVDDGSRDGTTAMLKNMAAADARMKVLFFSRNFGHQAAITAGLDHADGDAVVVMDADLQDPPSLLPEMLTLVDKGYDVVSAQRVSRAGESVLKRVTARGFYWLFRRLVDARMQPEVGDFRMFSHRAIIAIRKFREQHRFMRGMVAWPGLKEVILPYHRSARTKGTTKYSTLAMLRFAWTAVSSFSALPLRLSVIGGMCVSGIGVLFGLHGVYAAFVRKDTVPGWTSIIVLNIIFSGSTLMAIGLLGEYIGRIYEEAKGRPLYVVSEAINLDRPTTAARGIVLPAEMKQAHERTATGQGRV